MEDYLDRDRDRVIDEYEFYLKSNIENQDSDGDMRPLLDAFMECGVNVMHPFEPNAGMDIVEARRDLNITAPVGSTIPLFAGAVGKVFLAAMEKEQATKIISSKGLPRFTDNSIVDMDMYFNELRQVKEKGYAVDDEEYIMGVRAVASPLIGLGQLRSAIWAVGFKASLDEKKMQVLTRETHIAAKTISRRIQEQLLGKR